MQIDYNISNPRTYRLDLICFGIESFHPWSKNISIKSVAIIQHPSLVLRVAVRRRCCKDLSWFSFWIWIKLMISLLYWNWSSRNPQEGPLSWETYKYKPKKWMELCLLSKNLQSWTCNFGELYNKRKIMWKSHLIMEYNKRNGMKSS